MCVDLTVQGCTNSMYHVAAATIFRMVTPNAGGTPVLN